MIKNHSSIAPKRSQEKSYIKGCDEYHLLDIFRDPEVKKYIEMGIIYGGGEEYPSFKLKHTRTKFMELIFFFLKYHYRKQKTYMNEIYDPTYDGIQKSIKISRAKISEGIKILSMLGAILVIRNSTKTGYIDSSSYEVEPIVLEKILKDNGYFIDFDDKKPILKRVIHSRGRKKICNVSKLNYNNITNILVNKNNISKEELEELLEKKLYKISVIDLFSNVKDKILNDIKKTNDLILTDDQILQSIKAFLKMCKEKNINKMGVKEFQRRIKAWIINFNKKLTHFVATHGFFPKWKSLRVKLSSIWKPLKHKLTNEFCEEVITTIKTIKKAKKYIPSREKIWRAKEILVSKRNYLTFEENAVKIIANYLINLKVKI